MNLFDLKKNRNKVIFVSEEGTISSILANGFVEQLNQVNIYNLKEGIKGLKEISKAHSNALVNSLDQHLDYERDIQKILVDRPEFKEGVSAFLEKRKPNFRKNSSK